MRMNEWTEWHENHSDKIELVAGVDCWIWIAATGGRGYGRVRYGAGTEGAHRAAYMESGGDFANGPMVRHLCGNRMCVRPGHLTSGTNADNARDTAMMFRTATTLVEADVRGIRQLYRDGEPLAKIAEKFGIAFGTVFPIVMGKSFAHIAQDLITKKGNRSVRKLNAQDVAEIRKRLAAGESQGAIAAALGVRSNTISRVKTGARWGGVVSGLGV